jgi:uncharacterized protein (DUF427 family)
MTREMRIPGPDHPIEISDNPSPLRVLTRDGGSLIAQTTAAVTLREADYPPVHYIPLADVDPAALKRSDSHTYCPYKGEASYYHLIVDGQQTADAVWFYDAPYDAVKAIAGHVAFYPKHVQIITSEAADD